MVDYICAQGHTTQLNYARREAPAFLYTFCRQCGEPTRLDLAVKMNRYLRFEMVEKKPTTEVYVVSSLKKFDTEVLAKISWYGKWRRHVFLALLFLLYSFLHLFLSICLLPFLH